MESSKYVLLVEDDPDIRELVLEAFQIMNVEARSASCGSEAIQALQTHGKPAVVLLDLMMPKTDGVWFCIERRKYPQYDDVPVVILTADSRIESKAKELAVDGFLRKPVTIDDLMSTVNKYMPSKTAST
jgi:CheY-like chemotaxis protein